MHKLSHFQKIGINWFIFQFRIKACLFIFSIFVMPPLLQANNSKIKESFEFVIFNGEVLSKDITIRVKQNTLIEIFWISNLKTELHLHGYDKLLLLSPNIKKKMRIDAHISGRFPITMHNLDKNKNVHHHKAIAYIEIYPN